MFDCRCPRQWRDGSLNASLALRLVFGIGLLRLSEATSVVQIHPHRAGSILWRGETCKGAICSNCGVALAQATASARVVLSGEQLDNNVLSIGLLVIVVALVTDFIIVNGTVSWGYETDSGHEPLHSVSGRSE